MTEPYQPPTAQSGDMPGEELVNDVLQIDTTETGTSVVLNLRGELDANTAPGLREQVMDWLGHDRRVVIDTSELQFCGSSGLAVFIQARDEAAARTIELRIVVPASSPLRRVLHVMGLLEALPITPDRQAALR